MDLRTRLLLWGTRVLGWVTRAMLRRKLRTASPEKSRRIEQMFADAEVMRRDSEALLKLTHGANPPRSIEIAEATLEFNRKHVPEHVESSEKHLEMIRAMDTESKHLKALRESAGTDLEKEVALMREYHETNPNSNLGRSSLIGSLRKAGYIDEAISLCRPEDSPLGHYMYHQTLGHLLLEKKDWDGAIEQANLAQQSWKTDMDRELARMKSVTSKSIIAKALAGKGEKAEARKLFEECLRATSDKPLKKLLRKDMAEAGL